MDNNSPVCSAVNKIIDLFDLNDKVKVEVYSYKDKTVFENLWGYPETGHEENPHLTKLIVWDGIPAGNTGDANTSKYLTPIDWAVGYSLSVANKEKDSKQYPDLKILILDVDSQSVSDSDSLEFVYQSSNMDIMSMPWIRIFSTEFPCSGRDMEAFFRTLVSLGSASSEATDSDSESLESARKSTEEDKEAKASTLQPTEVCAPSTERPFFRLKIDAIATNSRTLINTFRDSSKSAVVSSDRDDIVNRYLSLKQSIISRKSRETVRALGNFFKGLVKPEESESSSGTIEVDDKPPQPPTDNETVDEEAPRPKPVTEIRDEPLLSMKETFEKDTLERKTRDLEIIKNIWAAFLTRSSTPGDSHAIANLVGPLLLMKEIGNTHVAALQSMLSIIGLLPDNQNDTSEEDDKNARAMLNEESSWVDWKEPEWEYKLNELQKNSNDKLKLILIDDMFDMGWGKVLCWAMGVEYHNPHGDHRKGLVEIIKTGAGDGVKEEQIIIKAASSAEWILVELDKLTKTDNRFNFSLDGDSDGQEILFLDLRLYPGKFKEEEAGFFRKLIGIAKKFTKERNKNLPWDGFTDKEINEIEDWLPTGKQEDPKYIKALTLLPRILALTDLSLPIVLFSSTGRRDITEKLKDYGNIITVFEKPRFTVDIPVDIASQTKTKFRDAIKKARQILKARQKIQRISTYKMKDQPKFNSSGIHVELFIDETYETSVDLENIPNGIILPEWVYYDSSKKKLVFRGEMALWQRKQLRCFSQDNNWKQTISMLYNKSKKDDEIYVGGLFTIFIGGCNEAAQKKADDFDNDLVTKGIRYFDSCYRDAPVKIKTKKELSKEELNDVMNNSKNKPDAIGFIRLGNLLRRKDGQKFDPFSSQSADNLFRITLISLIELFYCETLHACFEKSVLGKISVSVYAGTRVKPYYFNDKEQMEELKIAEYRLGMESLTTNDKELLYSISRDSIYPIVSDILSFHNIKRNIERVSGVKLRYKSEGHSPEYFVCRVCKKVKKLPKNVTSLNQNWCNCKNSDNIHPDYRSLHYIADEILGHVRDVKECIGYGDSIKQIPGGFDDILNDDLKDTIKASRYLDLGETVSAIAEVQVTENYKPGDYRVKPLLLQRIASKLDNLKGEEFIKLVQLGDSLNAEDFEDSDSVDFCEVEKNVQIMEGNVGAERPGDREIENASTEGRSLDEENKMLNDKQEATVQVRVDRIKEKDGQITLYKCVEIGGTNRKVRIAPEQIKISGINSISKDEVLSLSIYTESSGLLYGRDIRKVEDK